MTATMKAVLATFVPVGSTIAITRAGPEKQPVADNMTATTKSRTGNVCAGGRYDSYHESRTGEKQPVADSTAPTTRAVPAKSASAGYIVRHYEPRVQQSSTTSV